MDDECLRATPVPTLIFVKQAASPAIHGERCEVMAPASHLILVKYGFPPSRYNLSRVLHFAISDGPPPRYPAMTAAPNQPPITRKQPSQPLPLALEGNHWIESLRDGTRVLIRPLRPEDREFEAEFIKRLSPQSRRFRFLGDFKEPSKSLLDGLMKIDYVHEMAFVALVHDDGHLREIGVSRYAASGDGKQCECAVTVADDWRKRGLGVLLMHHLIEVARKNGMVKMFTMDDPANEAMRELAGYLGFRHEAEPDDPKLVRYTLDL